jgi:voltage-gated potassium channel
VTRQRLWEILEPPKAGDLASRRFDLVMVSLIALNVIALVVGTVPSVAAAYGPALLVFETFSIAAFTLEYLARLWACRADPRYAGADGPLRWALTPMALVDLLAILPFFVPSGAVDLRFLRAMRLFRVMRIAKLGRYSDALQLMGRVLAKKRGELVAVFGILAVMLLSAASLMYFAEGDAQPDAFGSIPRAFWWGIVTLTTVGYGDAYPVTALGKAIAGVVAVLGIGLFALPAGILGSGFVEEVGKDARTCPHCGERLS